MRAGSIDINSESVLTVKNFSYYVRKITSRDGAVCIIALILLVIVVSILTPIVNPEATGSILSGNLIMLTIRQNCAYGVMACGLSLVLITGNMDLSLGSIYSLCACVSASCLQKYGLVGGIVFPILTGLMCGAVNAFFTMGLRLNSFITTLALSSVYSALAVVYTSSGALRATNDSEQVVAAFKSLGQGSVLGISPLIIEFVIIVIIFWFFSKQTAFGHKLTAIGSGEKAARHSGIRTRLYTAVAFALCGLSCGIASVMLVSRTMAAQASVGAGKDLAVLLPCVIGGVSIFGGKGTPLCSAIGIIFVGFLQNGLTLLGIGDSYAQDIIIGCVLVAALCIDVLNARGFRPWKKKQQK